MQVNPSYFNSHNLHTSISLSLESIQFPITNFCLLLFSWKGKHIYLFFTLLELSHPVSPHFWVMSSKTYAKIYIHLLYSPLRQSWRISFWKHFFSLLSFDRKRIYRITLLGFSSWKNVLGFYRDTKNHVFLYGRLYFATFS